MTTATAEPVFAPAAATADDGAVAHPGRVIAEVRVPLTTLRRGQRATVCSDELDPSDAASLRAMGLRPDARITLCQGGRTCVVAVGCGCGCSCRIGLSRKLAERIAVTVAN